jgi:hypothetical protein
MAIIPFLLLANVARYISGLFYAGFLPAALLFIIIIIIAEAVVSPFRALA